MESGRPTTDVAHETATNDAASNTLAPHPLIDALNASQGSELRITFDCDHADTRITNAARGRSTM
jgi:hypothetical protein